MALWPLTTVGAPWVPLAAAVPTAAALAIILASRRGGYPAGPRETRSQVDLSTNH
ncbi:hypothetical protein [Arthrobacter sp. AZCC_0090]|uniref:hypothetical protein n=1 Tax=Arthrobacter sp. AZCC_0090 TaxID=2735881 RepID=UPI001855AC19|nr:hypothetical protein [Arthrobacter sp. AZCC_0090]